MAPGAGCMTRSECKFVIEVERTFAWLGLNRHLCKEFERLPESGVALIHIAMIRLMVRRLAPY